MKIFLDGGSLNDLKNYSKSKIISGFTTNPSLLVKSKIKDLKKFIITANKLTNKPISYEVTADQSSAITNQAKWINKNSINSFIKVPILNTKGKSNLKIIKKLQSFNCKINITAVFTKKQIDSIITNIDKKQKTIISIFAGRIADTGKDPKVLISYSLKKKIKYKNIKILWASVREIYNYYEAKKINCDIITMDKNLIKKLNLYNKNLTIYSKETSVQFYKDGKKIKF